MRNPVNVAGVAAVVFDMDGVLVDSEPLINAAAVAMFRESGLTLRAEDIRPFTGADEEGYIGGVAQKYNFPLDSAAAKKRTNEIYLELVPLKLEAFPGAVELVRTCKNAGLKVALASSADRIKIDANLKKIGLAPEDWDAIVAAEDVVHQKPGADVFLASAQKMSVSPERCVVIEDTINGVQAAKAVGMRSVAVAHSFPAEQLRAADVVKERISDVSLGDLVAPGARRSAMCEPASGPLIPSLSSRDGERGREEPAGRIAVEEPGNRPWGLWATLGLGLVIGLAFALAQLMVGVVFGVVAVANGHGEILTDPKKMQANGLFLAVTTCGAAPVSIGLTCFFAWLRKGISISGYLRLKHVAAKETFRWCAALLVLGILSDGLTWRLGRPIVPDVMVATYKTAWFPPVLWLAVVVLAPLNEEIFFRGFLFAGIRASPIGGWGAILSTSFLWAVIHVQYDWYGMANIFAVGLLLGYARMKTDSLVPTILMHALMNLAAMIQVVALIRFVGGRSF